MTYLDIISTLGLMLFFGFVIKWKRGLNKSRQEERMTLAHTEAINENTTKTNTKLDVITGILQRMEMHLDTLRVLFIGRLGQLPSPNVPDKPENEGQKTAMPKCEVCGSELIVHTEGNYTYYECKKCGTTKEAT